MKIPSSRKAAFTLVEILIVVGIIGLLAAIAIPNFIKSRAASRKSACINNIRQIDAAKQQWASDTSQGPAATPGSVELAAYFHRGGVPITSVICPEDSAQTFITSYVIGNIATPPECNIQPALHSLP